MFARVWRYFFRPRFATFDEIVRDLIDETSVTNREHFARIDHDHLYSLHHTLGRYIRNKYDLWNPDNPLTKEAHPDDISFSIIEDVHRRLRRIYAPGS